MVNVVNFAVDASRLNASDSMLLSPLTDAIHRSDVSHVIDPTQFGDIHTRLGITNFNEDILC